MSAAGTIDRALAWLWLGLLASVPVIAALASRSPTAMVVVIGLLAIALLVIGGIPQGMDRPLIGAIAAIVVVAVGASAMAETGSQAAAFERTAKSAGLVLAGVLAFWAALRGEPFASPIAKYLIIALFALGLALLALDVAAGEPIYRLLRGLDSEAVVNNWTFDRSALVLCVLVWPAVACSPPRWAVPVALLLSVLIMGTLLFTHSQTGPLVVVVSLAAYMLVLVLPRIGAMAIAGSVALYVASAPWLFIAVYGWAANQFGDWKVASAGARLDIWRVVAKLALERPFTGHGPNALRRMENIFSPEDVFMSGAGKTGAFHPHNFALQVWLDLGVAGAIAFIALILFAFWRMSALTRPLAAAGCAMLVAIIVVGSLSPGLWQGWWLGAIALAVCQFVVATKEREPFAIDQIGIRKERLG